jgi:hypothetical protein
MYYYPIIYIMYIPIFYNPNAFDPSHFAEGILNAV